MQLSVEHLYQWMIEVKIQLVKLGVTPQRILEMFEDEQERNEVKEVMQDMFHGNFHPAIMQPALPIDHPALVGPRNVAVHIKEVFFD